jgi:hypothetical protein
MNIKSQNNPRDHQLGLLCQLSLVETNYNRFVKFTLFNFLQVSKLKYILDPHTLNTLHLLNCELWTVKPLNMVQYGVIFYITKSDRNCSSLDLSGQQSARMALKERAHSAGGSRALRGGSRALRLRSARMQWNLTALAWWNWSKILSKFASFTHTKYYYANPVKIGQNNIKNKSRLAKCKSRLAKCYWDKFD